ncbi:MAG: hypothetical protein JXR71_03365 [Bacteroidales bacterium]|nr:hypothetical protein [Bacteroidales bacterium]
MIRNEKLKPAVPKKVLLVTAGLMWAGVGIMLSVMACHWLTAYKGNPWAFAVLGVVIAVLVHRFGFSKIVYKNRNRIEQLPDKPCLFSFISWKSYLIIIFMVTLGITLRHSSLPKQYLSIIYIGIGGALFLSSIHYFRNMEVSH